MQSSLLKFLTRREQEQAANKKRPSESAGDGSGGKRARLASQVSFKKLKQFARSKEQTGVSPGASTNGASSSQMKPVFQVQSIGGSTAFHLHQEEDSDPDVMVVEERSSASEKVLSHSDSDSSHPSISASHSAKKATTRRSKSGVDSMSELPGPSSKQYTPLEQQYIAIKAKYPDAVLFVECGYKYRFFGEDAEIASKVLRIGCFPDHNFMAASIPTHRLHVHLKRLVAVGYKVGVVKQMETAALKAASDRKSGPFTRELTALYTRTTLLGPDVESSQQHGAYAGVGEVAVGCVEEEEGLYMMCLCEGRQTGRKTKDTTIGFLALQPSAGNMVYDEFTDSASSFSELEMRLSHLQPAELLYPQGSSKALESTLTEWKRYSGIHGLRLERLPEEWFDYNKAFPTVTDFYGMTQQSGDGDASRMAQPLQVAINLPPAAICCLGALICHLQVFRLQRVLTLTSNLKSFSTGTHCVRLTRKTLENLEIFKNQTDKTEKGSLFWVLNHTYSAFGRRLLKKWVSYPLRSLRKIRQRQEAVGELSSSESPCVSLLTETLCRLPDVEKMLCSAYHKKCSPSAFCSMARALVRVHTQMQSYVDMTLRDFKAELLHQVVEEVPCHLESLQQFLGALHEPAAREGVYENLFAQPEQVPEVFKEKKAIAELQEKLLDYRKLFRKTLGYPALDYVTVSGVQYLVEVKNKDVDRVPADWTRISGTKQVTRFHPPYVLEAVKMLAQHKDQLMINAKAAWDNFLNDFSVQYGSYKRAVDLLATLDCLLSLAKVAKMPGYVCPTVVEEPVIQIEGGRHPVIDRLLGEGEQYVPNDTDMNTSGLHAMIITGPNMGGKSSYIKQVGLLCIMAQIGSYISASSATIGLLDAVYTRMGASDSIHANKSTFMVELMEASEILKLATPHSLVILDELGRGTSTHDGTAVAYATLTYFISKVKCMTLFVTHYPILAELEEKYPGAVGNFHMAYMEAEDSSEDFEKVVFLYQLESGQARGSYGLNVAALAGLDGGILKVAGQKSKELKQAVVGTWASGRGEARTGPRVQAFREVLELIQSGDCNAVSLAEVLVQDDGP